MYKKYLISQHMYSIHRKNKVGQSAYMQNLIPPFFYYYFFFQSSDRARKVSSTWYKKVARRGYNFLFTVYDEEH